MRYVAVAGALLAALFVFAFFSGLAAPPPVPRPLTPDCPVAVTQPEQRVCSGQTLTFQDGRWVRSGAPTPVPPTPQNEFP